MPDIHTKTKDFKNSEPPLKGGRERKGLQPGADSFPSTSTLNSVPASTREDTKKWCLHDVYVTNNFLLADQTDKHA